MKKPEKIEKAPRAKPKRKRARKPPAENAAAPAGGEEDAPREKLQIWRKAGQDHLLLQNNPGKRFADTRWFIERVEAPRLYAQAARELGAPDVSPRDYYCGCAPSYVDWLPLCEQLKPNCRFAGRALSDTEQRMIDDPAWAIAEYEAGRRRIPKHIKKVSWRYRGRIRPRGTPLVDELWSEATEAIDMRCARTPKIPPRKK